MRWIAGIVVLLTFGGCWTSSGPEVVVYVSLDSEFSQPILDDFKKQSGIEVLPKFDTETTKSVGMAEAIIEEANRPRCDVFWNNEILNTLRLKRQGLLDVYRPKMAEEYPASFRSPEGTWHGFAGRARVLIVNTENIPNKDDWPDSIHDLADEKWRGRCAIAKPMAGTTATHAACLFAHWGEDRAKEFFNKLKANGVRIESGNKRVAVAVAAGHLDFGLTDTDDAMIEKEQNAMPVAIVYPDQGPDGMGTLFIPNTLAIIKGSGNTEHARQLIDYLLSPEVEAKLAAGRSAQIPLNPNCDAKARVETPRTVKAMPIDFESAAEQWDIAREFLKTEFLAE